MVVVTAGSDPVVEAHSPTAIVAALEARDETVVTDPTRRVSGVELARQVRATAAALLSSGLQRGDVLATLTEPNRLECLTARYAAHLIGAAVVSLGTSSPISARRRLPTDARRGAICATAAAVLLTDRASTAEARALGDLVSIHRMPEIGAPPRREPEGVMAPDLAEPDCVGTVELTSGTTGAPRLVRRSVGAHARLVSHLTANQATGGRFLAVTPISRTAASIVDATLLRGGTVLLHETFDAGQVLEAIAHENVTDLYLSQPQICALMDHPGLGTVNLDRLRTVIYSGSPAPPRRVAQAVATFGSAAVHLYGSTELGGISTLGGLDQLEPSLQGSVGRPLPWVDVQIRRRGTDDVGAIGENGEVWVRTDTAMSGYVGGCDVDPTTWLPSGDYGRLDRTGCLHLTGRVGRVIKRAGIKVYPAAVEAALADHPDVRRAIVKVRIDGERAEHVQTIIDLKPGRHGSEESIRSHVAERLSPDHVPTEITFWSGVPLGPTGHPDLRQKKGHP